MEIKTIKKAVALIGLSPKRELTQVGLLIWAFSSGTCHYLLLGRGKAA